MDTIVKTRYGELEGFREDSLIKWFGIPFAKPPTGELRFKRAVECESWIGVKNCKAHGNRPIQFTKAPNTGVFESEDCLYLSIWRPDTEKKKLPVFVWIYGGGFSYGECSDPLYDGSSFARNDVIYVGINYRLGVLGFYDFTHYQSERSECFDSNCGFSDQLTALRWVKENIEAFGGDSNNITIAGESAGGTSVCHMMASPHAKGLFNKAISQSALPDCLHNSSSAKRNMDIFLNQMKLSKDEVIKLKNMDVSEMKAAAKYVLDNSCLIYPGIFQPGPVIDDLIPESSVSACAKGAAKDVSLIIGTNHDEGSVFINMKWFPYNWEMTEKMLELNNCKHRITDLKKLYSEYSEVANQMNLLAKDRAFLIDAIKTANGQSKHNDVWMYRFDYAPPYLRSRGLNAMHSVEIPIALNTFSALWKGTNEDIEKRLRVEMHNAWINFAKYGNPGSHISCIWEKYDENRGTTLIFDENTYTLDNPEKENFNVWKDIVLKF